MRHGNPECLGRLPGERATTGVKPSIEVKRPDTPEPLEVENLIDQQQENQNPQPQATPAPVKPVVLEDVQLKKALEVLQGKAMKAGARE